MKLLLILCSALLDASLAMDLRIIQGHAAKDGQFPYAAELYYPTWNPSIAHYCSATLIHPRWVLTAAHCLPKDPKTPMKIYMGSVMPPHPYTNYSGILRPHPEYDSKKVLNDIALIYIKPINETLQHRIRPVAIAPQDIGSLVGSVATVAGWGCTHSYTKELRWVELRVRDPNECSKNLPRTELCAGYNKHPQESVCFGDSGSGLVAKVNGTRYVIGVTSYQPKKWNGFTRVSEFYQWIQDTISSLPS